MKFERTVTIISIFMNHNNNGLQTEKYLTRVPVHDSTIRTSFDF